MAKSAIRSVLSALTLAGLALAPVAANAARVATTDRGEAGMIFVDGDIKAGDERAFSVAAARFKRATVVLESGGGNLASAMAMGRELRARGFSTMVPNGATCASACADVWLAGVERAAGPVSRIGFHASYQIIDGKAREVEVDAQAGYAREMGLGERAAALVTMAAPGAMTWLTPDAAKAVGIRMALVGGDGPAAPSVQAASKAAPTVFRDLNVRAAAFIDRKSAQRTCQMILLPEGEIDGRSYVTFDLDAGYGAEAPAVTFNTKAIHTDGQPREVRVGDAAYALDRGANWAVPREGQGSEVSSALVRSNGFEVEAATLSGGVVTYRFATAGLRAALERTAKACGKPA